MLIVLLFLTSNSCSNWEENKGLNTIQFNKLDKVLLEDFLSENKIEITPLETLSEALIGEISMAKYTRDGFFFYSHQDGKVHRFDNHGSYLSSIGKLGNGPGEYAQPSSFSVANNSLYILSVRGTVSQVMRYSLKGEFIEKEILEDSPYSSFEVSNDGFYFSTGSNDFFEGQKKIHFFDNDLNIKGQFLNDEELKLYTINENNFHKGGSGKLFFTEAFNNNVYQVGEDSISVVQSLDFGKYNLNKSAIEGTDLLKNFYSVMDNGVGLIRYYSESEDYSYLNFEIQQTELGVQNYHLLIHKLSGEKVLLDSKNLSALPLGFDPDGNFQWCFLSGNLKQFFDRNSRVFPNHQDVLNEINVNDNPVIIKLNLAL